ncbi:2208_t:CDS:10, partial [Dentiscutata heterogama]
MVEKEIIDISIKLFWNVNDLSATFVGPLEFTTVLNHGCTTIKDLNEPDTILLNGNSYKKIVDSDIHDLISPINNVSLEEKNEELMQDNQENEELMLDQSNDHIDSQDNQENEELILDQYNDQIDFQDNDNQENEELMLDQSNDQIDSQDNQRSPSQIDDSKDEIDDNSESLKVNEQSSEIQEDDDHQKLLLKKSKKRKCKVLLNISCKKKEKTQIQHASSSETDSDKDESTSLDTAIEELQITTTNEIEKNKAHLLKDNFEIVQKNQFIVYGDKLFSKNRSIEGLLITNFNIFNDINVINFSLQLLPSYSTNVELLDNYFKEWKVQYNQFKITQYNTEDEKDVITFDKSVSKYIKLELINIITINQLHADKKVV